MYINIGGYMAKTHRRISQFSGMVSSFKESSRHLLTNKFFLYIGVRRKSRMVRRYSKKIASNEKKIMKAFSKNQYTNINKFLGIETKGTEFLFNGAIQIISNEYEIYRRELLDIFKFLVYIEKNAQFLSEKDFTYIYDIINIIDNSLARANNIADTIKTKTINSKNTLELFKQKYRKTENSKIQEERNLNNVLKKAA